MTILLKAAAAFAVLAAASPALARIDPGGHWEWSTRPAPGPSRSTPPGPVRVWVENSASAVVGCTCPMMDASKAVCMMDMPDKHTLRLNG